MGQSLVQIYVHLIFRKKSFKVEFSEFLKKYEVEYDDRYVWED